MSYAIKLAVGLTLIAFAANSLAASQAKIVKSLEMWKPLSVTIKGSRLTVVAKESQVSALIYKSMLMGVCMAPLSSSGALNGLTEITVVNKHSGQGYVFEGGEKECAVLVEIPVTKTSIQIMGRTHSY